MSTWVKHTASSLSVVAILMVALLAGCPGGTTSTGDRSTDSSGPTGGSLNEHDAQTGDDEQTGGDDQTGVDNQAGDPNRTTVDDQTSDDQSTEVANERFQLTVAVTGSGSVDPAGGEFDAASQVTLTATAAQGWRFDHWEGDLTGSANPATVTVSEDMTVTAVFLAEVAAAFEFYAVYDRIMDTAQLPEGDALGRAALSADGQKVVFSNGRADTNRKAYALNADGSGLATFTLPDGSGVADRIAIDQDGSRAFFASLYDRKIFKLEGGAVSTINVSVANGPDSVEDLHTTTDGERLFFQDAFDVWQVKQDGTGLTKIIDDGSVPRDGGTGYRVWDFAVSDTGTTVVFVLWGYWTEATGAREKYELFVWQNGAIQQLTHNGDTRGKDRLGISGDGSQITYHGWRDLDQYYAIKPDGTGETVISPAGYNFSGLALTADGKKMFYCDSKAEGGRLVQTDASGVLNLFPNWNVNSIVIAATYDVDVSRDASHVFFRFEYASFPFKHALYVGHLNDPNAVDGAPRIKAINFSPARMPRGDASARVALAVTASDSDGLSDIAHVVTDEMLNGKLEGTKANLPAYFYFDPHDDGKAPDQTAGDGLYTTRGEPGGKINDLNAVTLRVGVQDTGRTVVVADTILGIGP